ncbi:MAG TPA: hypothetical protein VMP67_04670 [Candidatus Limnocylindria bacterium]|nr:hypothetical protein [Candidatus Limnocylindria bacterium]
MQSDKLSQSLELRSRGLVEPHAEPAMREILEVLRRRSVELHGRGRVAESLLALALDILGDDSDLHPSERRWLVEALAMPVSEAAHEAVDTLLREMAVVLDVAPALRVPAGFRAPVSRIDFE